MNTSSDNQLTDDPALLQAMLAEQRASDLKFHTTNYWKKYEKRFLPYLEVHGLKGFRSGVYASGGEVLRSFGASDAPIIRNRKMPLPVRIVNRLLRRAGLVGLALRLSKRFARLDSAELTKRQDQMLATVRAVKRGTGAKPVEEIDVSSIGEPGNAFVYQGNMVTPAALYYYMRYAFVSRMVDFDRLKVFVELSSGSGKQAELLAKLHPHLALVLFDIPPQLYVAHQYLSAVFPGRVVRFAADAHLDPDLSFEPGKIYLFGNWQIDVLRTKQVDLFWSAASLGEMEPDIAQYYLGIANECAAHIYLMQKMDGKEVARRPGSHGVLSKVTIEHYHAALSDFVLAHHEPAFRPEGTMVGQGYEDSFWSRQTSNRTEISSDGRAS